LHPWHAVLLAGMLPPFLGALASDIAFARTIEIQWQNFASWLLVGGLVFCGLTLACAIGGLVLGRRGARGWLYALLVLATFASGFIAVLVHAKDAWAMMPAGPVLSALTALLSLVAIAIGFAGTRYGGVR
jgi:uncharacterized membrane protein